MSRPAWEELFLPPHPYNLPGEVYPKALSKGEIYQMIENTSSARELKGGHIVETTMPMDT
jgi:hypothetical protein